MIPMMTLIECIYSIGVLHNLSIIKKVRCTLCVHCTLYIVYSNTPSVNIYFCAFLSASKSAISRGKCTYALDKDVIRAKKYVHVLLYLIVFCRLLDVWFTLFICFHCFSFLYLKYIYIYLLTSHKEKIVFLKVN